MKHLKIFESFSNNYNGIINVTSNGDDTIQYWFYINNKTEAYKKDMKINSTSSITNSSMWLASFIEKYCGVEVGTTDTKWISSIEQTMWYKNTKVMSYGLRFTDKFGFKIEDISIDSDIFEEFAKFEDHEAVDFDLIRVEKVVIDSEWLDIMSFHKIFKGEKIDYDVIDHWEP